jgi:hypothetical protein
VNRLGAKASAFAILCAVLGIWSVARVYAERRSVEDARAALVQLGAMEQSYRRLHGEYTDDVSALADMTDDWHAFMNSLNVMLDLKAGFVIETTRAGYRITAHARDRASTVVVYEGPPRKTITEAAKRR